MRLRRLSGGRLDPAVGEELVDLGDRAVHEPGEDVAQVFEGGDAVALARRHEAAQHGSGAAAVGEPAQ